MDIKIDRESPIPIYLQIRNAIREGILSGVLPEGFRLPPERQLAVDLGVNRTTVLSAYRDLKAEGLLEARVGRGTEVAAGRSPEKGPAAGEPFPWRQISREGAFREPDPLLRNLLEMAERTDTISLSVGLPAPEFLPLDALGEVLAAILKDVGPQALLHSPTEGVGALREAISGLMEARGIQAPPGEVLVTSGSQQGLDLVIRTFLEPGDAVAVEEPSYFGAIEAFHSARVRLLGVPTDSEGMRTDLLEALLKRQRPKLIYTLPTFQNPSGCSLSAARRRHLLDLAYRFQVPVLEDDSYSDLRYEGSPLPPLKALDRRGYVLYLSSFSKILFPGLRIGWVAAQHDALRQMALAKQVLDLHSGTLGQWVVREFIRRGLLARHLDVVRGEYARRRDILLECLGDGTPPGLAWTRPQGGYYVWCRLPRGVSQPRLMALAAREGVSYIPGEAFFPVDPGEHFARLSFCKAPPPQIREGVRRFFRAIGSSATQPDSKGPGERGTPPIV